MRRFPPEFEELLGPRGRRILAGRDSEVLLARGRPAARFVALNGALDPKKAARCAPLLDRSLLATLSPMEQRIPDESVLGMTENYAEKLPKTVRVLTALLENRKAKAFAVAEEIGLVEMLRSESFHRFAAALTPRPLTRRWGIQALCYRAGDYAGPHNDHHPEEPDARDGYLDVHLSFANSGVAHQWLVFARGGHLCEVSSVCTVGGITAYRLPFWHYTTPLVPKRGAISKARRWVLLGTFLFSKV